MSFAQIHATKNYQHHNNLNIGDKFPDIKFGSGKISDYYKNGGLIINFWATWCAPCIRELPVLDSIAGNNKVKLKVISVAYEDQITIDNFLKQHQKLKLTNLTNVTNDTVFVDYLKHSSLPYNVWIDVHGIIRHITHGDEITEENVQVFLTNTEIKMHEVKDNLTWDYRKPFHLRDSSFKYRSILTNYTNGIPSGLTYYKITKPKERLIKRIFAFNLSIVDLYRIAWSKMPTQYSDMDFNNLIEFNVKDSIKYFTPKKTTQFFLKSKYKTQDEWAEENEYCYELTLPNPVKDSIAFDNMFSDLQKNFNFNITVKKKLKDCIVITIPKIKKELFVPSLKDSTFVKITSTGIKADCTTLTKFFEAINIALRPNINAKPIDPIYINESGIDYPVDLSVDYIIKNPKFEEVKAYLRKKYGFNFNHTQRQYPILVLTERNTNLNR